MNDLRELVARTIGAGLPHHGETPDDMRQRALAKADAVLSAIGEHHAIVERVGEDVVEAAIRTAKPSVEAECGHPLTHMMTVAKVAITAAAPIIAAGARDAALEEAAKVCDEYDSGGFGEHRNMVTSQMVSTDLANALRALKSGGQHG